MSFSKHKKTDVYPIFESQNQVSFQSPENLVTERKFDTALRRSQLTGFYKRVEEKRTTLDDAILLEGLKQAGISFSDIKISDSVYAQYLSKILNNNSSSRKLSVSNQNHISRLWEAVKLNLQVQTQYMVSNTHIPSSKNVIEELQSFLDTNAPDNILCLLLNHCVKLSALIEKLGLIQSKRSKNKTPEVYIKECNSVNKWQDDGIGLSIIWSNRLCTVTIQGESTYLLPKAYILMMHNKICDLISVLVCSKMMNGVSASEGFTDSVISMVKELCKLNITYKLKYYTIAKSLESLVVAEALRKVDCWDNKEFFNSLTDELYESTGFVYEGSTLQNILLSVDIPSQHELGCLSKIVGHPLTDIKNGAKTLYNKTTEQYTLDRITLSKCECHIKINYIRNHIVRERKWPPCYLTSSNVHPAIKEAWARNMDPFHNSLKEKYGTPSVLDFQCIELLPNIKYSKLENTIPYLKDKTISLFRSKVISTYLKKAVEYSEDNPESDVCWKDTRLLLYYLMNPTSALNHDKYIDNYAASGNLEDLIDYLVIRCVPKEKELKVDPRFFGCKTYEERFRSLSQEKNAMKFLELYCDEQAMTLSELELARRLIAFRRLRMAYKDHLILYIVVDASSWNNHFRRETVDDLMINTLDKIYDTSIFGKTHMAYQKTLIHVPDEEEAYLWDGQSGGIEGLNQDTWVITYLAQIKTALDPLKLKYHALCKGDDLRIAICIPQHMLSLTDIPKFKNEVMDKVSSTAQELGHKIKIEESYGSLKYFAFSKEASVGDVMLPQTLRKIQKVHGYNNAFLPYLDDMCGSTFSNAHAACKVSPNVLPAETTGLFWLYFYLTQHPQYQNLTIEELVSLTLVPSLCGGLPIIYHHNMYVRAESDLLAPFIGLVKYCKANFPALYQVMINFCQMPMDPPRTLERVYRDPYAITTSMPALPSTVLRQKMEKMLPRITKNQHIQALIKAASSISANEFINALDSSNILPARVFSALYAASPKGVLSEFLTKFETARSVLQVLILGGGKRRAHRILRGLIFQEKTLQLWRYNMLKGNINASSYVDIIDKYTCPAECANKIRERSWGKRVETVTMPPLQHQVIMKDPNINDVTMHDINGHFTFQTVRSKATIVSDERPHYSSGDLRPFEGYTTRTGTIEPTMTFIEKDALLSKLQNIIELSSWTNKVGTCPTSGQLLQSNLYKLIETLVIQYTDKPMSTYAPFVGCRRSGTVQHHIRCPGYRESIVPNTLLNLYSHILGESDSNMLINKFPGHHYKINFLHVFCFAVNIIFLYTELFTTKVADGLYWAITSPCEYCMTPIKETPIVIDERYLEHIDFSSLRPTKLSEDAMEVLYKSLELYKDRVYLIPDENTNLTNAIACEGVVQELMETLTESKETLITRYTQHATTGEGKTVLGSFAVKTKRREIGLTELKRLSPKDLTYSLLNVIYHMIMTKFNWDGRQSLNISLTIVPASELPWYDLVVYLFNHGRMSDVFKVLAERTLLMVSSAFNTAENCAMMLGALAIQHSDYYMREINIVVLTNYDSIRINRHVARQLYNHARYLYSTRFPNITRKVDKNQSYTQNELNAILLHFYYWTIPFGHDDKMTIEHRNSSNEEEMIMNLIDFEFDDITQLWDTEDPQIISEQNINMFKYLLRYYKITWEILFSIHHQYCDIVLETLTNTLEKCTVTITVTTLSDCIGKVREIIEDNDTSSIEEPDMKTINYTDLTCSNPRRSKSVVPIGNHQPESWITTKDIWNFEQYPLFNEPYRHVEYLSRPFGIANCSMSTIYFILETFKLIPNRPDIRLNIICLADGIGNMASGLSKVYPRSHIVYSSLHTVLGMNYKPTELIMSCDENNCNLDYSSIRVGITDLYQDYTRDYFINLEISCHMLTCDIELREWSPSIQQIYSNILQIYYTKRSNPGILIIKINHDYVEENIWTLHVISYICNNAYLVHPPTIRCHKISYIVGYGVNNTSINWGVFKEFPMSKVSPTLLGTYEKFRKHCIELHTQKSEETFNSRPKILPAINVHIRLHRMSPMLFASMMVHTVGIYINLDNFYESLQDSDADNYFPVYAAHLLKETRIEHFVRDYKRHLSTDTTMYIRNRSYDLNIRAHRIHICQKIMFLTGMIYYFEYVVQKNNLVPTYLDIKSMYLRTYDTLESRDKYSIEPDSHFSISIVDHGINISYYAHFIKGINIAMTGIAFARSASVMGLDTRQRMQLELEENDKLTRNYDIIDSD